MASYEGLLDLIPVGDIAKQFGVSDEVAKSAIEQIIPTVVGGMAANAEDPAGAASLEKALANHQDELSGPVALKSINTTDGGKIVKNVFGAKTDDVAAAVAQSNPSGDVTKDLIAKLLPVVAPIIIAFLANQFLGQKSAQAAEPAASAGPDLGWLLGGLLGGGSGGSSAGGGGIGDLLGGVLGSQGGQDLIGGVLGGLLGGGRR